MKKLNLELEKDVESYLFKLVKKNGGICIKLVSPNKSGIPDRLVLFPNRKVFFVELKRPKGGVVSDLQIYWKNKLINFGFNVIIIKSKDEVKKFISNTMKGKDKHEF